MSGRRPAVVTAVVLWLVFAFLVWNVIFDRLVVLAGRRYSHDATVLYRTTGRYLRIDDVMRPDVYKRQLPALAPLTPQSLQQAADMLARGGELDPFLR